LLKKYRKRGIVWKQKNLDEGLEERPLLVNREIAEGAMRLCKLAVGTYQLTGGHIFYHRKGCGNYIFHAGKWAVW